MKIKFLPFAMLLSALFLLASCFGEEEELVLSDNTAITAFSVNAGKQYVHTKAKDGSDSVYVKAVTLSAYKFQIDQLKGEIYNTDSLPVGIDARKLLCTISSSYSGALVIQSMTSDSIDYFNSADSTDFSKPRVFYIYSNSAKYRRKYTIKVNIHREQADSMAWTAMPASETLRQMSAAKSVVCGGRLFVFGNAGGNTVAVSTADGKSWRNAVFSFNHTLAADAYNSVVVKDGYIYIADQGTVMRSSDADAWEVRAAAAGIKRLVAASRYRLYAYADDGRLMASADNGATWSVATVDADLSLLPDTDVSGLCLPMKSNTDADRVMIVGKSQGSTAVWGKVDEKPDGSEEQSWNYYDVAGDNTHRLPAFDTMTAFIYDGAVYTFGIKDSRLKSYRSDDGCITWHEDTVIAPAAAISVVPGKYTVAADSKNYIWVTSLASGEVWRGRINRLGWSEEQKVFTKE